MYYELQVTTLGGDVNTWRVQQIEYLQEPTFSTFPPYDRVPAGAHILNVPSSCTPTGAPPINVPSTPTGQPPGAHTTRSTYV